jgi:hypothetical protein
VWDSSVLRSTILGRMHRAEGLSLRARTKQRLRRQVRARDAREARCRGGPTRAECADQEPFRRAKPRQQGSPRLWACGLCLRGAGPSRGHLAWLVGSVLVLRGPSSVAGVLGMGGMRRSERTGPMVTRCVRGQLHVLLAPEEGSVLKWILWSPRGDVTTKSLPRQNCMNRARPVQTAHQNSFVRGLAFGVK